MTAYVLLAAVLLRAAEPGEIKIRELRVETPRIRASDSNAPGLSRQFNLEINGRRSAAGDDGWPVFPGRPNRLTLSLREPGVKLPLKVTLVRTQPDGRQSRSSAMIEKPSDQADLDLGLFAVPAKFDFEAGVLYRRGARLRLEISTPGDENPLETWQFVQTIGQNRSEIIQIGDGRRVPHHGGKERAVTNLAARARSGT